MCVVSMRRLWRKDFCFSSLRKRVLLSLHPLSSPVMNYVVHSMKLPTTKSKSPLFLLSLPSHNEKKKGRRGCFKTGTVSLSPSNWTSVCEYYEALCCHFSPRLMSRFIREKGVTLSSLTHSSFSSMLLCPRHIQRVEQFSFSSNDEKVCRTWTRLSYTTHFSFLSWSRDGNPKDETFPHPMLFFPILVPTIWKRSIQIFATIIWMSEAVSDPCELWHNVPSLKGWNR